MSSDYFLNQLGIKGLEEFDLNSPIANEWIDSLEESEDDKGAPVDNIIMNHRIDIHIPGKSPMFIKIDDAVNRGFFPFLQPEKLSRVYITLNGQDIYKSDNWDKSSTLPGIRENNETGDGFINRLLNFFETESSYALSSSDGRIIGSVKVKMDPNYVVSLFILMGIITCVIGVICLISANIMSKFFTISIAKPLIHLEEKIRAISSGDFKAALNTEIELKKPLREIESIAASTNGIMHKMKEYSELLESQKNMLEAQNEELEAQNEELIQSRNKIEETKALLVQSEKMASIGQLTAAITHEINTPLGAINSNIQLFNMFLNMIQENSIINSDKQLSDLAREMREANDVNLMACDRVIQIIKSLKTFTKLDQAEFQEADLNEGLKSALVLTSNLWKSKVAIYEEYGDIPHVMCYSGLINQVFMNIIVNAIQSIEDKGEIHIRTYADNKCVYVSVKDNGSGIKPEHLSRIFESGFSTKVNGVGAGLGLSICSNIIKKHNGEIHVSTEVGKGTEFVVSIPVDKQSSLGNGESFVQ